MPGLNRASLLLLPRCMRATTAPTALTAFTAFTAQRTIATSRPMLHDAGSDGTMSYEDFNAKYQHFFEQAEDLFEVQRGMNNAFMYDIVPSVEVCEAALRACRRVSDYATAVRLLQGLYEKCPKRAQYELYLAALKPTCEELGVDTKEHLGFMENHN